MVVRLLRGPFSVADYHRLGKIGMLGKDDRVELINGQIVQMTPIGTAHAGCVGALTTLLSRAVGKTALVWVQNPIHVGKRAEPQPDLAVLRCQPGGYRKAHPRPRDVLLVIEVGDSSVEYDRDVKLLLYARAGIPEAWLVNLAGDGIEVGRKPGRHGYARVRIARRGETLSPLLIQGVTLRVVDILG